MDVQQEQRQQQKTQEMREGTAAVRETLNSTRAAIVVTSADDYRKPEFIQRLKQFMEETNAVVVGVVVKDDENHNAKQRENTVDGAERNMRNGRQFYPIIALDNEPTTQSTASTGSGFFSIMPIAFDWRQTVAAPFAAFYTPATAQTPLRIWAIGSVAKFPPFIEHFVQRVQSYYSVYKYEDLSRPGFHFMDGSDQVVRVSTSSKQPTPIADVTVASAEVKSDEATTPSTTTTTTTTIADTTTTTVATTMPVA